MSEEVKIKYDEIKKKKTHRYCVFFIKDEKLIAVEKMAPRDANYEEFLGDLMACGPEDCRYGLYDFEYEHQCQVCVTTLKSLIDKQTGINEQAWKKVPPCLLIY